MLLLLEVYGAGLFWDKIKRDLVDEINKKFPNNHLPRMIEVVVSSSSLPPNKIAKYDNGVITVHPKAIGDRTYLRFLIMHELIHASFKEGVDEEIHHWGFHRMADELGLPQKYRD